MKVVSVIISPTPGRIPHHAASCLGCLWCRLVKAPVRGPTSCRGIGFTCGPEHIGNYQPGSSSSNEVPDKTNGAIGLL